MSHIVNSYAYDRLVKSGLQVRLDAAHVDSYPGSGNTWNDISGNGKNFSWNSISYTSGSNPYFSTLGRRCTGPASNLVNINNSTGYTVYLIMYQNALQNTGAFKFYGDVPYGRGIFSHCTWSDGNVYFDQGGCCDANQRTSTSAGAVTQWNIFVFSSSVSQRFIYKNNSLIASNSTAAANINLNGTAIDLGSTDEYGGSSSTWDARLSQFIVYNRALSIDEMNYNYESLRVRYGL
jgi:hypothetical protein